MGLVPFAVACAEVDAALFVGGRLGLGAGLRDDETSGLTGFFRRGRRGFDFWLRGGPLGFPEGALILMLGRALTTEILSVEKGTNEALWHELVVPPLLKQRAMADLFQS